jgi:hypothetical protein
MLNAIDDFFDDETDDIEKLKINGSVAVDTVILSLLVTLKHIYPDIFCDLYLILEL